MMQTLSEMDPQTAALWFCGIYFVLWFYVTDKWPWILLASTASVLFLRYAMSISNEAEATLPPVATLVATLHWGVVYMCFSTER